MLSERNIHRSWQQRTLLPGLSKITTKHFNTAAVVDSRELHAVIYLPQCPLKPTGCFCYPLGLFFRLIKYKERQSSMIPLHRSHNSYGESSYSSPWDTEVYQNLSDTVTTAHVVHGDVSPGWTTMSKSGTQGVTFLGVQFSNLCPSSEI